MGQHRRRLGAPAIIPRALPAFADLVNEIAMIISNRIIIVTVICLLFIVAVLSVVFYDDIFVHYKFWYMVHKDASPEIVSSAAVFPETALKIAKRKLTGGSLPEKYVAILVLADLGDTPCIEPLTAALHDKSPTIQFAAAKALLDSGTKQAVQSLSSAINHEESSTRLAVYFVLAKHFDGKFSDKIIERALHDDAPEIRRAILQILMMQQNILPDTLKARIRHLQSDSQDEVTSRIAAIVLARQGDEEAVRTLVQNMKDLLKAGKPAEARDYAYELAKACGQKIVPTFLESLSGVPGEHHWAILDAASSMVPHKEFDTVREFREWWEEEEKLAE